MDKSIKKLIDKENKRLSYEVDKYKENNDYLRRLKIIVGCSEHEKYVEEMHSLGKKVLLCADNSIKNLGFLDIYIKLLKEKGFTVCVYTKIVSNPMLKDMLTGVKIARKFCPDFILAIGGGSTIDTAKVISIGIYVNVWDCVEGKSEIIKAIPLVAISTTSGTGSQLTPYAVITNSETLEKKTLKNSFLVPKISISDLEITKNMPKKVIASTGFDVLCHALEVMTRKDCSKVAESFCKNALSKIKENLIESYEKNNLKNKIGMIYADIYSGIALALIGTHAPHAISHPISARLNKIVHGEALASIIIETIKKQIEKNSYELNKKFVKISKILGGDGNILKTLEHYKKSIGLKVKLPLTKKERQIILEDTIRYRWRSIEKSPVKLSEEDVKEIIFKSFT